VRSKLALSYAGFLLVAWAAFVVAMAFVLHYVPDDANLATVGGQGEFVPDRSDLIVAGTPVVVVGTFVLLAVGLGGGWLLAGRMLRPLTPITEAASQAAMGSLSHRIAMDGPDDELRRTADVFDAMLSRLERAFDEQRRFTSNASHELRTPLATVKTMLEVAAAANQAHGADPGTLITRLQAMNNRSIGTVEAMLRLAHIGRVHPTLLACDLADIARDSQHAVEDEALRGGINLDVALSSAPMMGDPILLGHLVTNLLLNAVRHNTASNGRVTLRTRREPHAAIVEVENTGCVLEPEVVATLAEPFVRGHERVRPAPGASGSGLGLSIVSSVARVHHAHLTLQARPQGGLLSIVHFPTSHLDSADDQPSAPLAGATS
jgi:two-component system, OmpR family, sensor histidine kinase VanS